MGRQKKAAQLNVMTSPEQAFINELEVFRTESESAAQFFYAYLGIHAIAGDRKEVYRYLNTEALFWNTSLGALQTAAFVALGRVFDTDSAHNIGRLLRIAQDNRAIFSKMALGKRKQEHKPQPPDWLPGYLKTAYEPAPEDFRRLRRHVAKHRRIYEDRYRDLRHMIFAHKGLSDPAKISALFARTNIREMQRMLVFLMALHEALWQLFNNGRKPILRPVRYSVARMRKKPSTGDGRPHERLLREAEMMLRRAASAK